MRTLYRALIVGVAAGVASPALAGGDLHNGYTQIRAGDYVTAERIITAEMRNAAKDTDLMLNLATVYVRTGRTEQARALYQTILLMPEDEMDLSASQSMSSHDLARAGLSRIARERITAR